MYIPSIFKDMNDCRYYYYLTKAIAEDIEYHIDEIESLKGDFMIDVTFITVNIERRCIEISTQFINMDNHKRYSWDTTIKKYNGMKDFLPKIVYEWFNENWQTAFDHGIYFNGNP